MSSCRLALCLACSLGSAAVCAPIGSSFSYQGQLRESGLLANGLYDFRFCLYDDLVAPVALACAPDHDDVPVAAGVFSVDLDFGAMIFAGEQRYLELQVRPGASSGSYTQLSPRQPLRAAPEALRSARADSAGMADSAASASSAPWTGLTGVPAGFADNVDDQGVTQITAGNGLIGGTITGSGAISVDPAQVQARIGSGCNDSTSVRSIGIDGSVSCQVNVTAIDPGAAISTSFASGVATVGITPGGVGQTQIDPTQVQVRVQASCDEGQYLRAINVDGSVVCEPLAVDITRIRTLVPAAEASLGMDLAVTADDRAVLAYRASGSQLAFYRCATPSCSSGSSRLLEAGGGAPSVTLRADGRPLIAHQIPGAEDLRLYSCDDVDCSSGSGQTLESAGLVGREPSLAIRPDGRPAISYRDETLSALKLYDCVDVSCSGGNVRVLDNVNSPGIRSALAIRGDGRPLVAYLVNATEDLRLYRCNDVDCSTGASSLLDGSVDAAGLFPDMIIRADGRPLISYAGRPGVLLVLRAYDCDNADCTSGTVRSLLTIPAISVGAYSSATVRPNGRPLISYRQVTNPQLGVFDCADAACSSGTGFGLDANGDPGFETAIGMRSDGRALVGYGINNGALRLLVCGNGSCQ
ncbi:MAG: hypothetical protein KDI71_01740 [Xanthomonadales bacterium]|nr:hypothetical protein [Xanthomonadales bacterium]